MKIFNKAVSEILTENSRYTEEVILHIHYDPIDEKNHKSQKTISHLMGEAGFKEIGQLIEEHKFFIYVSDYEHALHAHNFLNEHSAAIGSTLHFKGLSLTQAEDLLLSKIVEKKSK